MEGDLYRLRRGARRREDFNPRPPCGGRQRGGLWLFVQRVISTLALLVEGDIHRAKVCAPNPSFQPSPSLRRATDTAPSVFNSRAQFQPAPSLRRATLMTIYVYAIAKFQPAPSLRRATAHRFRLHGRHRISTRALLAEGDSAWRGTRYCPGDFNPRPPCGGRRVPPVTLPGKERFQPSPSLWRATLSRRAARAGACISTLALLVEGDRSPGSPNQEVEKFQPSPSLWRATFIAYGGARGGGKISTLALLVEGDSAEGFGFLSNALFQPSPSLWRATFIALKFVPRIPHFNPRPPCGGRRILPPAFSTAERNFNPRPPCGGRRS